MIPASSSAAPRCLFWSLSASSSTNVGFKALNGLSCRSWTASYERIDAAGDYSWSSHIDFTHDAWSCVITSAWFSAEKCFESCFQKTGSLANSCMTDMLS